MERDLVDLDVDGEPGVLHRVAGEVLHARQHVALETTGQRRTELADVMRVLAVRLLRPTPRRVPQHVDAHRPGEVRARGPQLTTDGIADPLLELRIPGCAASHRDREAGGVPDHRAPRAVAEPDAGETDPLDLGPDERGLVVAVLAAQVGEAGPGRCVAVEAPEPLLARQRRDQRSGDLIHRLAGRDCGAGLLERIDDHRAVSWLLRPDGRVTAP